MERDRKGIHRLKTLKDMSKHGPYLNFDSNTGLNDDISDNFKFFHTDWISEFYFFL